jgi:hypothetical protein
MSFSIATEAIMQSTGFLNGDTFTTQAPVNSSSLKKKQNWALAKRVSY